jgi:MFS family permease
MLVAAGGLTVGYLVPVMVPSLPLLLDSLRLWVLGFFASSNVLAFATAKDLYPARVKELVVVFVNLVGIIGTMILPMVIGWLLTIHHPGGGAPVEYAFALNVVLPVCGGLALLAALGTTETLSPHTPGNAANSAPSIPRNT